MASPARGASVTSPLAGWALGAISAGVGALVVVQALPAAGALNPMSVPISKYVFTNLGWLFDVGGAALAVGVLLILVVLVRRGRVAVLSAPVISLAACGVGLVGVVVFPDYTVGNRLTMIGWVHFVASVAVFIGPPVAPLALHRRYRQSGHRSRLLAAARWVALAVIGWLVVLVASAGLGVATDVQGWQIIGLIERGLAASDVAIAVLLAFWADRLAVPKALSGPPPAMADSLPTETWSPAPGPRCR